MSEWISVKTKPKRKGKYLAWILNPSNGQPEPFPLEWSGRKWVTGWTVTHWMPLPERPEDSNCSEDVG